jgi:hypothetical protein
VLAYTLGKMLELQRAVIERDQSGLDQLGAEMAADWQVLATVACRFYWRKESGRGPAKEVASAQRTVGMSEGGLILPAGTDILIEDRISAILDVSDLEGDPLVSGPLVLQAVFDYGDHVEVSWISP